MKRSMLNTAALVDLKAELLRKQELAKQSKLQQSANIERNTFSKLNNKLRKPEKKKPQISSLKESLSNNNSNDANNEEEEKALAKSRAMLEQKTKIYDELSKGQKLLDDEESERYLVNFERKSFDFKTAKDDQLEAEKNVEDKNNVEYTVNQSTEFAEGGDDWVDFVDDQGKQRRCLREDLPLFRDTNRLTKELDPTPKIPFWETKRMEALSNPVSVVEEPEMKGPVHYENIRHREVRTHGVGYFAFSENEEQRKQQLEMLNNMRDQTLKQRDLRHKMKEKRSTLLAARLAKVKQRKNIAGEEEEESKHSSSDESVPLDEIPLPEEKEQRPQPPFKIRPWDKGKDFSEIPRFVPAPTPQQSAGPAPPKRNFTGTDWYEKRRTERQPEFAPPELYSKTKTPHHSPWKFSSPVNTSPTPPIPAPTAPTTPLEPELPPSHFEASNGSSTSESPVPSNPENSWQQPSPATSSSGQGNHAHFEHQPVQREVHVGQSESNQWSNVVGSTDPSGTVLGGNNMNPEEVSRIISEGLRFFRNQT